MEYFGGINAELPDDDEETKAEKKAKRDGKELAKKAGLLEWLQNDTKPEKKSEEKTEKLTDKSEVKEEETVEVLDEKEEQIVAEQLVSDHLEAVEEELNTAQPESEEEAGALSVATFLEKVGDKLDKGETIDEQVLDEAVAETAGDLGLPLEEISQEEPSVAEGEVEIDEETGELTGAGEQSKDDDDDVSTPPATPVTSGSGATPPPVTPPTPPTVSHGSFGPTGGGSFATPRTFGETPQATYEKTHSHVPYVLAGGLLGYLLGRRRGRIKTEQRLIPVQQKLEKQVDNLNQALLRREETIRRLGARHRQELSNLSREQAGEIVRIQKEKRAETLKIYEKGVHKQPEKLGKFALITNNNPEKLASHSLSEKQLLEVSKQINLHGTSLEALYKAGRIELKDLKEIVEEFLRGGSYEKLLISSIKPEKHEVLHQAKTGMNEQASSVGATKLAELLPTLNGTRNIEQHHFGRQKETHIVARVAMVSAGVVVVVMVAIIMALVMLGAL